MPSACPCGREDARRRPLAWAACCARYIDGGEPAPDAESLMRSRYCAFVLARSAYLLATWHASTRPATLDLDAGSRWLGLAVQQHRVLDTSHAEVRFLARLRDATGRAHRLHEHSRFVRENGQWFYVDGDALSRAPER